MTLIYFILVLGVTVLIHELGHFIFAKRAGVHVYEFSIGMGPRLFKWNRKNDETEYSLRLLPIGGYVQMAGEDLETKDDNIAADDKVECPYASGTHVWNGYKALFTARPTVISPIDTKSGILYS